MTVSKRYHTTQFTNKLIKCAICGKEEDFVIFNQVDPLNFVELDMRPADLINRKKFTYNIQHCLNCNYVNFRLDNASESAGEIIKEEGYLSIVNDKNLNEGAKVWFLEAYIKEKEKKHDDAMLSYLHAAWFFDDLGNKELAVSVRTLAIAQAKKHLEVQSNLNIAVILLDLYRRTGNFNDCIRYGRKMLMKFPWDRFLRKNIKKEIRLAKDKYGSSYTVRIGDLYGRRSAYDIKTLHY